MKSRHIAALATIFLSTTTFIGCIGSEPEPTDSENADNESAAVTNQNAKFKEFIIENGYGAATTVSVSPGYGATVHAQASIDVVTVTQQGFHQMVAEAKNSAAYKNDSKFRSMVNEASFTAAASFSGGLLGKLLGGTEASFDGKESNVTSQINQYNSGSSSDNHTVANKIANIMVKNQSHVKVTGSIAVTGQLLVPSATLIAVETTTFTIKDSKGNSSTVTMLDQSPVIPVDTSTSNVSNNTVAPGSHLTLTPIK